MGCSGVEVCVESFQIPQSSRANDNATCRDDPKPVLPHSPLVA